MKNPKRPTMTQKLKLKSLGIIPNNWLVSRNTPAEFVIVHRVSGEVRRLGA